MRPPATSRNSLDELPPECRFALRALASGVALDAIDVMLHTTGEAARNPLRTVARWFGGPPPARAAGDEALLAALAGPLEAARTSAPGKPPATACPSLDVLSELAAGRLGGPILLATAEHAADCPACLVEVALSVPGVMNVPPRPAQGAARRGIDLPLVLGTLAGLAVAAWYLFLS